MICNSCVVEHFIKRTVDCVHFGLFPEEFDSYYDSIADAKGRRQGTNPMRVEYVDIANTRRAMLGVSKLLENGTANGSGSRVKSNSWVENFSYVLLNNDKEKLRTILKYVIEDVQKAYQAFCDLGIITESVTTNKGRSKAASSNKNLSDILRFSSNYYSRLSLDLSVRALIDFSKWLSDSVLFIVHKDIPLRSKITPLILLEMDFMRNTKPHTINGARGLEIGYKRLHGELDSRCYKGERPSRVFKHVSMGK